MKQPASELSSDLLAAPSSGHHIVHLYREAEFPGSAVAHFVSEGLSREEAVVVIATAGHWEAVARRLAEQRFDVGARVRQGQLVVRDAATCLAELLVDGKPDRERFLAVVGGAIAVAERAGYARVRAFGEMVDLLRRTDLGATIRLEELWTELLAVRGIALLCAYSLDVFEPSVYRGLFQRVCVTHTHLLPVEDRARLDRAVEQAFADVFGADGEADVLRRQFLDAYVRPTVMPDGEAAILAAREFVPIASATLLERARHHYGGA